MPVVLPRPLAQAAGRPDRQHVFGPWKSGGWSEYTLTAADRRTARCRSACTAGTTRAVGPARAAGAGLRLLGLQPRRARGVRETYRKRFAIETSYRQMHQGRIRTTTRNPVVRLLYVGVALVLRNVWVWLHYTLLADAAPRAAG